MNTPVTNMLFNKLTMGTLVSKSDRVDVRFISRRTFIIERTRDELHSIIPTKCVFPEFVGSSVEFQGGAVLRK